MDVRIRRLEDNMFTLGTGILFFGVWTFIKFVLSFFFIDVGSDADDSQIVEIITYVLLWTVILSDFAIRAYLGISARGEGRGKRGKTAPLIWGVFLALMQTFLLIFEIVTFTDGDTSFISAAVTLIIDGTSLVFLVELFVSSLRLRRLRKLREKEALGNES